MKGGDEGYLMNMDGKARAALNSRPRVALSTPPLGFKSFSLTCASCRRAKQSFIIHGSTVHNTKHETSEVMLEFELFRDILASVMALYVI